MNPVQIDQERWLVKTSCHVCFIDVEHSEQHDEFRWIGISLLSTHAGWWSGRLRTRIAEAWSILNGRAYASFELNTAEETDALVQALTIARAAAFGSVQSQDQVRPQEAQGEEEKPSRQEGNASDVAHPDRTEREQDHGNQ